VGRLERQFRRSAALAATAPITVLHGDPHPGNTYALPGRHTGFYDWQLACTGHWSHDVGYFIVSSLGVDDRRSYERELLTGYVAALRSTGIVGPEPDYAWERYRATPAYGLGTWMHTLSAGSFQPLDACLATIRRFVAAYDDLETARSVVAD
jgi:aminoglycoside phosphotransferase (APT) family kinase protein